MLVALALLGAAVATYLALAQLSMISSVWDPLFGTGSERVVHSSFSRSLPFPDAALGVAGYLADAALGLVGGTDRWRRMAWVTFLFGAVVVGLALGGIGLVVVQAAVVHSWCTLCLVSAAISVLILALSRLDEPRAAWDHVQAVRRRGGRLVGAVLQGEGRRRPAARGYVRDPVPPPERASTT